MDCYRLLGSEWPVSACSCASCSRTSTSKRETAPAKSAKEQRSLSQRKSTQGNSMHHWPPARPALVNGARASSVTAPNCRTWRTGPWTSPSRSSSLKFVEFLSWKCRISNGHRNANIPEMFCLYRKKSANMKCCRVADVRVIAF